MSKAISELNEAPGVLENRLASLRTKITGSEWFSPVFEERLDDQFLTRYLRVAKMDEDNALERIQKMFALQKGFEFCKTDNITQKIFPYVVFRNVFRLMLSNSKHFTRNNMRLKMWVNFTLDKSFQFDLVYLRKLSRSDIVRRRQKFSV